MTGTAIATSIFAGTAAAETKYCEQPKSEQVAASQEGAAADESPVDAETVVNLGDEGLTTGDVIDDYLDEFFTDGVEVRIPSGEYAWNGDGFGGASRNAAVIGEGEVILNIETDGYTPQVEAEEGTVALQDFTFRGQAGPDKCRFRLQASEGATVSVRNVNFPDGAEEGAESKGYYVPDDHAGSVEIRDCYIANFDDNGIYASSPGKGEDGRVVIEHCVSQNNNISGFRVGSTDSVVRNCLVINDDAAPGSQRDQLNMRGIRVREAGENITIENCDIVHSYEGAGAPIQLHEGADGGSGTISNVRILNNTDTDAIYEHEDGVADGWEGENISITGEGETEYPADFDVCEGGSCQDPKTKRFQDVIVGE
ncbi:right-handed parallel beta-helix repeat-containing protein (plasmid) [Haloferacaceae archaeon DSL9]